MPTNLYLTLQYVVAINVHQEDNFKYLLDTLDKAIGMLSNIFMNLFQQSTDVLLLFFFYSNQRNLIIY